MKTNTKNSFIICILSIIISLLSISICSFVLNKNAISNQAISKNIISIYENSEYDYIINNPSVEQIVEIENNPLVEHAVPFYQIITSININGNDIEVTMISTDDNVDLDYTEFSKKRLVSEGTVTGKVIYFDYGFAKRHNIKIGDVVGSDKLKFTVAGLYSNYDEDLAYVPNLHDINENISYSGVYVKINNVTQFESNFIPNYKPLGTLKSRDSFTDDNAYNEYLNEFNSRDFSSYIIGKNAKYNEVKERHDNLLSESDNSYLLSAIISGIILLISTISLLLIFIRSIKFEIVDGGRKNVIFRYLLMPILAGLTVFVTWSFSTFVACNLSNYYITFNNVIAHGWLSLFIPLISIVVGTIVNFIVIQSCKLK